MSLFQQLPELPEPGIILIDENISPKAVRALAALLVSCNITAPVVQSVQDFQKPYGPLDAQWIPEVDAKTSIIVSGDRGKSNNGKKLPRVCVACGVRHVLLGNSVAHLRSFEKIRALLEVWEDLVALRNAEAGARYSLRLHQSRPVLVHVEVSEPRS